MAFKDDGVNTIDDVVMRIRKMQDTFIIVNSLHNDAIDSHQYRLAAVWFMRQYGLPMAYIYDEEHILGHNVHVEDVRNSSFSQPLVDMAEAVYRMASKVIKVYSTADDPTQVVQDMLHVLENLPDPRDVRLECGRWSRLVSQDNKRKIYRVPPILAGPAAQLAGYFSDRIGRAREGQRPALVADYRRHLVEIHTILAAGASAEEHVEKVNRYVHHVAR